MRTDLRITEEGLENLFETCCAIRACMAFALRELRPEAEEHINWWLSTLEIPLTIKEIVAQGKGWEIARQIEQAYLMLPPSPEEIEI